MGEKSKHRPTPQLTSFKADLNAPKLTQQELSRLRTGIYFDFEEIHEGDYVEAREPLYVIAENFAFAQPVFAPQSGFVNSLSSRLFRRKFSQTLH